MAPECGFTAVKWVLRCVQWFLLAFVAVIVVGSGLFFLWVLVTFRITNYPG
jgi:hypothetical protein